MQVYLICPVTLRCHLTPLRRFGQLQGTLFNVPISAEPSPVRKPSLVRKPSPTTSLAPSESSSSRLACCMFLIHVSQYFGSHKSCLLALPETKHTYLNTPSSVSISSALTHPHTHTHTIQVNNMVKHLPFGTLQVPSPGFGAMGISHGMGTNLTLEQAEPLLLKAIELGCTFWDTAVGLCHVLQATAAVTQVSMADNHTRCSMEPELMKNYWETSSESTTCVTRSLVSHSKAREAESGY